MPKRARDGASDTISSLPCQLAQARGKFFVDATEPSVRKNGDHVSTAQFRRDGLHDGVGIGEKARPAAVVLDLRGQSRKLKAFVFRDSFGTKHAGNDHFISLRKTVS